MRGGANWQVRDKARLILAVIEKLGESAHMSLEGDLQGFDLMKLPGASDQETVVLRRSTAWPEQDFAVIPLESSMEQCVLSAISGGSSTDSPHTNREGWCSPVWGV
jgi:hypothetical protein